jgi:hypothetical protein
LPLSAALRIAEHEGMRFLAPALGLGLVCALVLATGCQHTGPIEHKEDNEGFYDNEVDNPVFNKDNGLPFQPNRIWRLKAHWDPYLLDRKRAMVVKQFQLIVHGDVDRRRLENEIKSRGGDERYLRWFEAELFPLGNWELRDDARVTRLTDGIVVSLRTHALKEVPVEGEFTVSPVWFPDPVMKAANDACGEQNWEVIPQDTSVGFEVILQSRLKFPTAERWDKREFDSPTFTWRQWSVGLERSVAYRTLLQFKTNVSRCPMPPYLPAQFATIARGQKMGVDW